MNQQQQKIAKKDALRGLYSLATGMGDVKESAHIEDPKALTVFIYDPSTLTPEVKGIVHRNIRWILALELLSRMGEVWDPDTESDSIRNWAATILELVFPNLITKSIKLGQYYIINTPAIDSEVIRNASLMYPNGDIPDEPEELDSRSFFSHLGCAEKHTHGLTTRCAYESDLLPPPVFCYQYIAPMVSEAIVFCNVSVFLFLIGKQATAQNITAFHVNRPRALINKYNLSSEDMKLWNGSHKPSIEVMKAINTMWTLNPMFRAPLATELAYWTRDTRPSTGHDIIATTYRLLRWQGMGHVAMIKDLLLAWPEAKEIPDLVPYIDIYMDSSRKILEFPDSLRPYSKIIAGDRLGIFRQQDIRPLTALAYRIVRENNPTLARYVHDDTHDAKLDKWIRAMLILKGVETTEETPRHEETED
jgi:hypothetical protein